MYKIVDKLKKIELNLTVIIATDKNNIKIKGLSSKSLFLTIVFI